MEFSLQSTTKDLAYLFRNYETLQTLSSLRLCTETTGEIKPLEVVLRNRADIFVRVGTWRWSETSTWPPLHTVLKTPLWCDPKYDTIRERLKVAAPTPSLTVGGEFITVNVRAAARATAKPQRSSAKTPALQPSTPESEVPAIELTQQVSFFLNPL